MTISFTQKYTCLYLVAFDYGVPQSFPKLQLKFYTLGRYIPKYFILFVAMVNGIVSLISFSTFSLLVYRNARDF